MDNREYNLPEGVDFYSPEFIQDIFRYPAIGNVGNEVYILRDNAVLCTAHIGSSYMDHVRVYLTSPEALEIFKDDYAVKFLGKHASFPFGINTGFYEFGLNVDDSEDRGVGLTIVDKRDFDWGFASKMRYAHIPGFGDKTKDI